MISQNFIEDNFPKGQLTLVGGRQSVGKTAFAITLAVSMAKRNRKVIYFSLEENKEQLVKRIRLQNRHATIEENIVICDTPAIRLSEVRSQLVAKSFDYILIDSLQLMKADNQELFTEEGLSSIVCCLKEMAGEFDVPIIAMSQIDSKGCLRDVPNICLTGTNIALLSRDSYEPTQMLYKFFNGDKECITHFFFQEYVMEVVDIYGDFLSFNDLVILYPLNRLDMDDFNVNMLFEAKKNPIKHTFPHLNTILHDTYGLFVFQEQLMEIAQYVGGFSEEDSIKLYKAMSRRCVDEVDKMKPDFIRNAVKNGYTEQQADNLYQWMIERSIYLFRRGLVEKRIKEWLIHIDSLL